MNQKNLEVLTNIIGAVESGHQVYGQREYSHYAPPYHSTSKEHTITIGWYCAYGHQARTLIQEIKKADSELFKKLDTAGIDTMLSKDWEKIKWNPNSKQKNVIISMIDSKIGHKVQDSIFIQKMKKLVADCQTDYPQAGVKAQMMYCQIRHLGGKTSVNRIFKRCNGKYDIDSIMVALVADQKDTSSSNQVGDKLFWSRHVKCKQFIETYAEEEEKEDSNMAVLIGHARHDEYGRATGGSAGDQKQTKTPDYSGEVSMSNWYLNSKGWVLIRAKDATAREKIAKNMEYACNNKNIGYDQSQNRTLYNIVKNYGYDCSKVTTKCETDCAQLVRVCVLYAGISCGDFYTASEKDVLNKTGKFTIYTDSKYTTKSDYLLRGDILVTKTKGHTVVVLSNGSKVNSNTSTSTSSSNSSTTSLKDKVKTLQNFLNINYAQILKTAGVGQLTVDGNYGSKTRLAALSVWKYMANKYYGSNLTIGNSNFFESCKVVAAKMTDAQIAKHTTLESLKTGILAGRGYSTIKAYQNAKKLSGSGSMNADTWYSLFN